MSINILIIKLSALGDFVQAFPAFQAIRKHHPTAHISLLTTKPFVELAKKTSWFDDIYIDKRPKIYNIATIIKLRKYFLAGKFDRIYDLQTNDRTSAYKKLFYPQNPEWSGIAKGCSHPHVNPNRDNMHSLLRQAEQLQMAGINNMPMVDMSWLRGNGCDMLPNKPFILLIPGGAAHRLDKRWPAEYFAELACLLEDNGFIPVIVGTKHERGAAKIIKNSCPNAHDLIDKTNIFDLATLAFNAVAAVGNDTGPMHLSAMVGCPSLVLYSNASNPDLCGQRGTMVDILKIDDLHSLKLDKVWQHLKKLINYDV